MLKTCMIKRTWSIIMVPITNKSGEVIESFPKGFGPIPASVILDSLVQSKEVKPKENKTRIRVKDSKCPHCGKKIIPEPIKMKIETDTERHKRYKEEGFPIEAMTDKDPLIRLEYFERHGYTIEAMTDKHPWIRLRYFRKHDFPEEALKDKDWLIRYRYFERHGFTIEALKDEHYLIRGEARKHLEVKDGNLL